ncbi:hypothetical protein L1987_43880 [Smallanthus sonchifolius]|uniref:Uncharacterized protein n=1 Tax=Smallanthus sonchifolius TaxID=185202 RepID=A0ACB9GP69_9ASTR|nr:hypothetical protein L1987_43880 [Smallanthus sonchifolius]
MEDKTRKDQLQAVWFAAGMAVVIACVERAVVFSIFKQWHMWVFLTLNLLLIAILFTSTHPKSHTGHETEKKQSPGPAPAVASHREDVVDDGVNVLNLNSEEKEESYFADEEEEVEEEEDDGDGERSSSLLSNEELNERVEAFISRFRQQYLVADVKIRRSSSGNVCGRAVFSKTITV